MQDDRLHVDGNAAAGLLREIFGREMTSDEATCADCGKTNAVGALTTYTSVMGTMLRCPGCDAALVRVMHIRNRYCVDRNTRFGEPG